jgi:RNA polymerase sigma factor (sigma-70 family)
LPLTGDDISELYRGHARDLLVYFTQRVYDPEVALDLVAETFAAAFDVRSQFRGSEEAQAIAWIYGIAHHQVGRYFRRGAVERRALQKAGVEVPAMKEPDYERVIELAGLEQLRGRLAAALAELPDDQARAIQLRIVEERSYADVAAELGVSEQAARARVSRGLRALAARTPALNGGDLLHPRQRC